MRGRRRTAAPPGSYPRGVRRVAIESEVSARWPDHASPSRMMGLRDYLQVDYDVVFKTATV